jgi:hypothetical protein
MSPEDFVMLALDELIALSCLSWLIVAVVLIFDHWSSPEKPVQRSVRTSAPAATGEPPRPKRPV